jgi:S1-C subfamily serine protease
MKKRVISVLMIIVLLAGVLSVNALAAGGLSNFSKVRTYSGQFTDVPASQWYADEVQLVYEYGLIDGLTSTTFGPDENLTIAQAIKLAAVLHSIYNTGTSTLTNGSPWYQTYVDYALENGIIASGYSNYNTTATRADFAIIFAGAFPAEALTAINNISSGAIPDGSYSYSYGPAVYLLYRAGILTGSGADHAFHPNDSIKRSEVSAIAARMANSGFRQSFSMTATELTATEIAAQCSPAVFYIVVFDGNGNAFKSGSGFFINSTGLAVTNYHVIEGASSALIMTTDDEVYDVTGVYDYNEEYDLALLQVDGSGFPFLPIGDSDTVVQGATVYAIGNPQGMTNTFSQGIVSNAAREFSDTPVSFIQFDAAISSGSSGGALINTRGEAIGVTAATVVTGQNLNLAIPINLINEL